MKINWKSQFEQAQSMKKNGKIKMKSGEERRERIV